MKARSGPIAAFVIALMAAGCSNDGTLTGGGLNTSSRQVVCLIRTAAAPQGELRGQFVRN